MFLMICIFPSIAMLQLSLHSIKISKLSLEIISLSNFQAAIPPIQIKL